MFIPHNFSSRCREEREGNNEHIASYTLFEKVLGVDEVTKQLKKVRQDDITE